MGISAQMDYNRFYKGLFVPIEERVGPIDEMIIGAIIGFDCGGPIRLSTVGSGRQPFVMYVTCELAFRDEQRPSAAGRYEAMMMCDDEDWARNILTKVGQMSFDSAFGHGHTVDIGPVVAPDCRLQGLIVEEFACVSIDEASYALFQFHGVTRPELEFATEFDVDTLLNKLKDADIYPRTSIHRQDSVATVP
jgi:hypothetical protein